MFGNGGVQRPVSLLALGGAAAVAAITWSAPGVAASLLLLALAVEARDALLFGLGVCTMVGFGTAFYYWLDLSLLWKSGVLVASVAQEGLIRLHEDVLITSRNR